MTNKSDNKAPQHRLKDIVTPEVYGSHLTDSLYGTSFDRMLSKDDGERIAGYIGSRNKRAVTNRQIVEDTAFRQLNQLQPVTASKVGNVDSILTYEHFLEKLAIMGVDLDDRESWANLESFNFVPPVNFDMLVNYGDYYWAGPEGSTPQYITIENKCNKLSARFATYNRVLESVGSNFDTVSLNVPKGEMVVRGSLSGIFVEDFVIFTTSIHAPLNNKFWTVRSSSFNERTGNTTIKLQDMSYIDDYPPSNPQQDQFWYSEDTRLLNYWNGVEWVLVTDPAELSANISLEEIVESMEFEKNCACYGDVGWDKSQWDDNQAGTVLWNESVLEKISFETEEEWSIVNTGPKTSHSLWYDTARDELKLWHVSESTWKVINDNFSVTISKTTGRHRFDMTIGCEPQVLNDWSEDNHWVHKTDIESFSGLIRAKIPILEFSSDIELNEWVTVKHSWKYRNHINTEFERVSASPSVFELRPITGFVVGVVEEDWYAYMYHPEHTYDRDLDMTDIFKPGYELAMIDDEGNTNNYRVASSEFRSLTSTDNSRALSVIGRDVMVTVVKLQNPIYYGPATPTSKRERFVPIHTSLGDLWLGYQHHWVLEESYVDLAPTAMTMQNTYESHPTFVENANIAGVGLQTVTNTYQEIISFADQMLTITLDHKLTPVRGTTNFYANADSIRVYKNGRLLTADSYKLTTGTVDSEISVGDELRPYQLQYVKSVQLLDMVNKRDVVRVSVAPHLQSDVGRNNIPVRTIEDDVEFENALIGNTQPKVVALNSMTQHIQHKSEDNQYPLFNIYDILDNAVVRADAVFKYAIHPAMPINDQVGRRILATPDGREFGFEQELVNDDGEMFAYRESYHLAAGTAWYNSHNNTLQFWDGSAWNPGIFVTDPNRAILIPHIGSTAPVAPTEGTFWYQPRLNKLMQFHNNEWIDRDAPITSRTDPTLYTIWRTGDIPTRYMPKLESVVMQDVEQHAWEIIDPWSYNISHENRKLVRLSQLSSHLRSIMDAQAAVPGVGNGGSFILNQRQFDFGLGGKIKEYNDNLDLLVSAMRVKNGMPTNVIEFAKDQYGFLLSFIREELVNKAGEFFTATTADSMIDLTPSVVNNVRVSVEQNSFLSSLYYDSTSLSDDGLVGAPNWIATLPINGVINPTRPFYSRIDDLFHFTHHDGHRSVVHLSEQEVELIVEHICNHPDGRRTGNFSMGIMSIHGAPQTRAEFENEFGTLSNGLYWYNSTLQKLYRFQPYAILATAPSTRLPEGVTYYNTSLDQAYELIDGEWKEIGDVGEISALWVEIDTRQILADSILNFEDQLYRRSVQLNATRVPTLDMLEWTSDDETKLNQLLESTFLKYAVTAIGSDRSPYTNTEYVTNNPLTWNYSESIIAIPPTTNFSYPLKSDWRALYQQLYNTPYPHLEPWKLQGYDVMPTWWMSEYESTDGTRRWKYDHDTKTGMWQNVMTGIIPIGRIKPNGEISTAGNNTVPQQYQYVSVNISNNIVDDIPVDGIMPPYFRVSDVSTDVRSVFTDYGSEIIAPNSNYTFGSDGPLEWNWKNSIHYQYDIISDMFKVQPIRMMRAMYGPEYTIVGHLQVDVTQKRVLSHKNDILHSDIHNGEVFKVNGMSQWYVNYTRFVNRDLNGEFRSNWSDWNTQLGYLTSRVIDTDQLNVRHKYFDITDKDYTTVYGNTGIVDTMSVDALRITILSSPADKITDAGDMEWRFDISTNSTSSEELHSHLCIHRVGLLDNSSGEIKVDGVSVSAVDEAAHTIYLSGNLQTVLLVNDWLVGTDGRQYLVTDVYYDASGGTTRVTTNAEISGYVTEGDVLTLKNARGAIHTGDLLHITTEKGPIIPLLDSKRYYAIVSDTGIKLAESQRDAEAGIAVPGIFTIDDNLIHLRVVDATFNLFGGKVGGNKTWYHHTVDQSYTHTYVLPMRVQGMQNLLDLLRGVESYYKHDTGIVFEGGDILEIDPDLGRAEGWQLETERFLTWATMNQKQVRMQDGNAYPIRLSHTDPTLLTIEQGDPEFKNGTKVMFSVDERDTLPIPLQVGKPYYYYNVGDGKFRITDALDVNSAAISVIGSSRTPLMMRKFGIRQMPVISYEFNPFRTALQINTPIGIISDIFEGPYAESTAKEQNIFDQFGKRLTSDEVLLYRQDESSIMSLTAGRDAPRYIGGVRLYVEGYEHVILFNNYTVGDALIYDPFVGVKAEKLDIDFYRSKSATRRPTLGGFYKQGNKFNRNIEGSVEDLRYLYDPYSMHQNSGIDLGAKELIGYRPIDYMREHLGAYNMSQFIFYQGMIRTKGSNRSIKAIVNSKHFVAADIDELWARKVGEFGDSKPQLWPELSLRSSDSSVSDIRFKFTTELGNHELVIDDENNPVNVVNFEGESAMRWIDLPDQKSAMLDDFRIFKDAIASKEVIYAVSNVNAQWFKQPSTELQGVTKLIELSSNTSYDVFCGQVMELSSDIKYNAQDSLFIIELPKVSAVHLMRELSTGEITTPNSTWIVSDVGTPNADWINSGCKLLNSSALTIKKSSFVADAKFVIYNKSINVDANSPTYLMDRIKNVKVATMPIWDPARGAHSSKANYNIDIRSNVDPAKYTTSIIADNISSNFWNSNEVGTRWLDLSRLVYMPYYDSAILPITNSRLNNWGLLQDWASVDVYEWVESSSPPDVWEAESRTNKTMGLPKRSSYYRTRHVDVATIVQGSPDIESTPEFHAQTLRIGMTVTFYCDGIYPTFTERDEEFRLDDTTKYYIVSVNPLRVSIYNPLDEVDQTPTYMTFTTVNVKPLIIAPQFDHLGWKRDELVHETIFAGAYSYIVDGSSTTRLKLSKFKVGDTVRVYRNGTRLKPNDALVVTDTMEVELTDVEFNEVDIIDIVKLPHQVTDEENAFDPDDIDDATINIQWKSDYEYSTTLVDGKLRYFFWVSDRLIRPDRLDGLSVKETAVQLQTIPGPYVVTTGHDIHKGLGYFKDVIIRGAHGMITDDSRYSWRIAYDYTLRDQFNDGVKPKHEQWMMFREQQNEKIDKTLWNKVVECIVGYDLDTLVRVPALERESYDIEHGTFTRYGLGAGQAFTKGSYAMASILGYLGDTTKDFYPMDLNVFMSKFDIDTDEGIIDMMDELYETFPTHHVNSIWFEVLHDALAVQPKYQDLMKTSWIVITGVRLLNVEGILDD